MHININVPKYLWDDKPAEPKVFPGIPIQVSEYINTYAEIQAEIQKINDRYMYCFADQATLDRANSDIYQLTHNPKYNAIFELHAHKLTDDDFHLGIKFYPRSNEECSLIYRFVINLPVVDEYLDTPEVQLFIKDYDNGVFNRFYF